jgi:hypothetical protein
MEYSPPREANRFSASQEIPCILWKPKVHYRFHNSPPPVPIPSHTDPVHAPSHPTSWRSILIFFLPSMPGSSKWSLSLRFPDRNTVHASPLPHTRYMPRSPHSSRFYHLNNIRCRVQKTRINYWMISFFLFFWSSGSGFPHSRRF